MRGRGRAGWPASAAPVTSSSPAATARGLRGTQPRHHLGILYHRPGAVGEVERSGERRRREMRNSRRAWVGWGKCSISQGSMASGSKRPARWQRTRRRPGWRRRYEAGGGWPKRITRKRERLLERPAGDADAPRGRRRASAEVQAATRPPSQVAKNAAPDNCHHELADRRRNDWGRKWTAPSLKIKEVGGGFVKECFRPLYDPEADPAAAFRMSMIRSDDGRKST